MNNEKNKEQKFKELNTEIQKLLKEKCKLQIEMNKVIQERQNYCDHPEFERFEDIKDRIHKFSVYKCALCGKYFEFKRRQREFEKKLRKDHRLENKLNLITKNYRNPYRRRIMQKNSIIYNFLKILLFPIAFLYLYFSFLYEYLVIPIFAISDDMIENMIESIKNHRKK